MYLFIYLFFPSKFQWFLLLPAFSSFHQKYNCKK